MKNKKMYAMALCFVVFLQMGGVGLSPVLADMNKAFPQCPAAMIQMVSSLPSMFVAVTNLFIPLLCRYLSKKYMMAAGSGMAVAFAFLGFFFHESLAGLYIWSGILGIGTSMACTVAQAAVNEMFTPKERVDVYGKMAFTASIGTMMMTFAGGFLVRRGWHYGYLVYLLAVSGLLASLIVLPVNTALHQEVKSVEKKRESCDRGKLLFACASAFFVGYLYNVAAANIGMLVTELKFGDSGTAGFISTVMLLVGGIAGLCVNRISRCIGYQTITLGYLSIFVGFYLVFCSKTLHSLYLAAVLCGGAISFVMPFAQVIAADADASGATAGIARTVLFSSVGMLFSPVMTPVASIIMGTELVRYRFLLASLIGLAYMIFAFLFLKFYGKGRQEENFVGQRQV